MDKYENAFEKAQKVRFDRFQFDDPDVDMLIVNDENDYLEHLKVQAAGMAYYTALFRQCERNYDEYERKYKYRYNEMYSDCSELLAKAGKKNNVRDIEAFVLSKYSNELKKMEDMLSGLKAQRDNVGAFLEGWRQKSYTLTAMTQMITAGLLSPKETITEQDQQENSERIKEIFRRRRQPKEKEE